MTYLLYVLVGGSLALGLWNIEPRSEELVSEVGCIGSVVCLDAVKGECQ